MKKYTTLVSLFVMSLTVLSSCAPAAGRPAIPYMAQPSDIIGAAAQFGPQIQPGGAFNYLGIETIGDNFITLAADQTTGMQVLGALGGNSQTTIRITLTTVESGDVTQVAVSGLPRGNSVASSTVDKLVGELDTRFRRAPQ